MALVIAEIGFSHGGDIDLAIRMIEAASGAGADAVKFQSFFADDLYFPDHELYPIFKAGEISVAAHAALKNAADANGIGFLSTPFSPYWVDVLDKLSPMGFKIASMDINNPVLLKAVAAKGREVFISTGASDIEEAARAVRILRDGGASEVCVMHCVSNYPTDPQDVALYMIPKLRAELGTPVGFSDHTLGVNAAVAAAALGAEAIEKHFTLDKNLPGPDHKISADPEEMARLVKAVKDLELEMDAFSADHHAARADAGKKKGMRRGIYAGRNIAAGETVTLDCLKLVRPQITPLERLDEFLGKPAPRAYKAGESL
ncbi:MAG: N-acetylneuraminate synthase family protein [Nitrospinae bacterium]|nr:N-acetylneuraminate synthase family protein [Nitrospinota bacterium]